MNRRSFASDNAAPIAPEMLEAIVAANNGDAIGYGHDAITQAAVERFREHFGRETDVYFTFNGTGANVFALSCALRPWQCVLAPASAHLQTDECGAFERFTGSKVIPIVTADGKLRSDDIEPYLHGGHDEHFAQPRIVTISQTTEFGDVYEIAEMRDLCTFAHENGLLVHVDGARISNAAAALGATPRAITVDCGVDMLTFGGTKNGLMGGEAVCFFHAESGRESAPFARKQAMQLASKMRFVAAQFDALLQHDRWRIYASHANAMAQRLAHAVGEIPEIEIVRPVRANAVFAKMDRSAAERAREEFFFYTFDESVPIVRWMTHWATTSDDVDAFAAILRESVHHS